MEEPPATLLIQGFLRPAFSEEHTVIQRHLSSRHSSNGDIHEAQKLEDNLENRGRINHQGHESSSSKDGLNMVDGLAENIPVNDASFYRLEMIKVQLCTGHAHPVRLISVSFCSCRRFLFHIEACYLETASYTTPCSLVRSSFLSL